MRRREFLTTLSTIAIAAPYVSRRVWAQSQGELRVQLYGGDVGKANIEAYAKPFETETGIKVIPITDDISLPQLELMVTQNNVTIDVVAASPATNMVAAQKGYLEKIDYSIYRKEELDAILEFAKQPYGVAGEVYSWVMFYNEEYFPANKPRPTSWAEFWDVKKFPGVRTLETGQYGSEGPWEEALLADGVAADSIYPMDIDRVFASLDKIKPHIRKWWTTGSEVQQMLREKAADIGNCYDGRAALLIDEGAPVEITRNQAKLTCDYWGVVKGSPNAQNAQKFIEFATRAKNQAAFAQRIAYGPPNLNAYKLIPEERGRRLSTHPDNLASGILLNTKWYSEIGSDGLSNAERLRDRWNQWILL
ncbi:MAG: ABC transporter substrate-binding protein [Mesorhizobium sp.]|uniref:ABC transporter substrate-binding protein n=1 Tax=Mesorhizobium sp. TaxID=1871066 RepID=UPI000FE39A15|nr:ABC transporter substrate-binding protein [Mesorhizobium sp.]RWG80900.1 MAG: ABC transporter substrate-binding protein [Mesorhizobium sp.]RWI44266.1 MAG: ABC transporter substrate-binding protein [Mesorhizobium sp.]RWJ25231.1 MAG: ABC transporter substrate-binding protein [Mesorhizobium sp.]RWJ89645.1 MAG: ABC transporter substrate-binding protein [Mesorhizobium sp.]RWK15025.1 MAG: ABC transporter substrate-binding protein [Mesorhizobium sp.]